MDAQHYFAALVIVVSTMRAGLNTGRQRVVVAPCKTLVPQGAVIARLSRGRVQARDPGRLCEVVEEVQS